MSKLFHDYPHLPMEARDNLGWYNVMLGQIYFHCNIWQPDYLREGTSRNKVINWETSLEKNILK